jgi:glycosyltransferase involved in cell wall biosynthesis
MNNNWDLIEKNEASKNANGGTELFMRHLYDGNTIPREMLLQTQIIPSRIRTLDEEKIRILTLHDLPEDPESQKLAGERYRDRFHKFVFVSNWQYQQYRNKIGFPYDIKSVVIEHAIEPSTVKIKEKPSAKETVNIVYMTTPHRGLEILVPVFEALAEEDKNIHLHVHSSFKIYGWDNADDQYKHVFEKCKNHPQITYHGYTEYSELCERMKQYHINAYPSIWEETACRQIIEGMSAGMMSVHPNFGALPDTSGGLNFMYDGSHDLNRHAATFMSYLKVAINAWREDEETVQNRLMFNKSYVDTRFNPTLISMKWQKLIGSLLEAYPDIESRKFPTGRELPKEFIYKTS